MKVTSVPVATDLVSGFEVIPGRPTVRKKRKFVNCTVLLCFLYVLDGGKTTGSKASLHASVQVGSDCEETIRHYTA